MSKKNAEAVLGRLKSALGTSSDSELCRVTGVNRQTLGNWKARDSVPYTLCVQISEDKNISLDWLLTGDGDIYRKPQSSNQNPPLNPREKALLTLFNGLDESAQREIQLAVEEKKRLRDMEKLLNEMQLKLDRGNSSS